MSVGLNYFLALSAALFAIGCFGLLSKRSIVVLLMSAELMLNAANVALIAFTRFGLGAGHPSAGAALAMLAALAGGVELAAGAAIAVLIYRQRGILWVDEYDAIGG